MQELTCCDPLVVGEREWLPVFDMRWSLFQVLCPGATEHLVTRDSKQQRADTSLTGTHRLDDGAHVL